MYTKVYSKEGGRPKVDLFPLLRLMFDSTKEETASVGNISISILQASVYTHRCIGGIFGPETSVKGTRKSIIDT